MSYNLLSVKFLLKGVHYRVNFTFKDKIGIDTVDKSKAAWDMKKQEAAVYAIQGRRPHMEDRFNIVNKLEHTNTSIYGIFDGHGGEVRQTIR